jgi:hypothetical protein
VDSHMAEPVDVFDRWLLRRVAQARVWNVPVNLLLRRRVPCSDG